MELKTYFSYFSKTNRLLKKIHEKEGLSLIYLWIDSSWCFIRYGCTSRQYVHGSFYRYRTFQRRRILTMRGLFRLIHTVNNKEYIPLLEDKEKFNQYFCNYVHRKWIVSKSMTLKDFKELYVASNGLIVKPLSGTEGGGIYRIDTSSVQDDKINNLFIKIKSENVIIEQLIQQHPDMFFGSTSVNTLRVMNIMNKQSHQVKVFKAVLRAGTGDAVVDNYHAGGYAYEIDLKTGCVCSKGVSANGSGNILHPGTNICMLGFQIPHWSQVMHDCINAHMLLPQCRFISWDVAITREGTEFVEGNHNGDYDMIEFIGSNMYWPLLKKYL